MSKFLRGKSFTSFNISPNFSSFIFIIFFFLVLIYIPFWRHLITLGIVSRVNGKIRRSLTITNQHSDRHQTFQRMKVVIKTGDQYRYIWKILVRSCKTGVSVGMELRYKMKSAASKSLQWNQLISTTHKYNATIFHTSKWHTYLVVLQVIA